MTSETARVEYQSEGPIRIVGEIDLANADEIGAALAPGVAESNGRLALDLSGVTFIDSTGIKMLIDLLRQSPGLRVEVAAVTPQVEKLLAITGFPRTGDVIVMGPLSDSSPDP